MKRRKFIIGTGALFAGSAAAMGTGAVTSVNANNRQIVLDEDDDSEAALVLEGSDDPNGAYVTTEERNGDEVVLFDFTLGGEVGFNEDATYYVDNALVVGLDKDLPGDSYRLRIEDNAAGIRPYTGETDGDDRPFQSPDGGRTLSNQIDGDMAPGERVHVGFKIETDKAENWDGASMRFFAQRND